ncbi:MAG: hypothetical protein U9N10_02470 [Bacillota bacterium]|nr:hypothetical protein [Bacillota bacterium]
MKTKKKIVIVRCDDCGKENRIKESDLSQESIQDLKDNYGCYCSKCFQNHNNEHEYAKAY